MDKVWFAGLCRYLSFLASVVFVLPGTVVAQHNLWYNFTVMAQDGSVQPTFFAEGRLDGQAFLRRERGTVEPQGLWAKNLSTETWRKETKDLKEKVEDLRKCLGEILGLQKEKGGLHSLQEIVSCEMGEDSHPRGVRRLYYDGELLLSCGRETHGCTVSQASAQTLALEMEKTCDMDELSRHYWAHVRGELCAKLQGYLKSWTSFTERTVPPAVTVTCSQALEGTDNLTCQAVSFSPQNISVAWYQDEKAVSPDTQQSGGVLPDGNGTYRTWVTLRVPQGEEQRFSCHVEHGGNHSVHAVPCGKAPGRQHRWWIISGALTLVIFIMTWFCSYTKMTPLVLRHRAPGHTEGPEIKSELQLSPTPQLWQNQFLYPLCWAGMKPASPSSSLSCCRDNADSAAPPPPWQPQVCSPCP